MVRSIVLVIATQSALRDQRLKNRLLRDAATREVDGFQTTDHDTMIACRS